jgi:maltose alpha-D-glucosyltransferase/alpha-amylase
VSTSRSRRARDPLWYKDAVIYQLPVRSFFDSNADGVGDIAGLIEKLDYLKELGITCLWLMPLFPSPLKDDGYDITRPTAHSTISSGCWKLPTRAIFT